MQRRQSKKRDAILRCLRETKCHPSAEWIYEKLKDEFDSLSLGTVYRNLNQFVEEGLAATVGTIDGQLRFDGDVSPHCHLECSGCGAVIDVQMVSLPKDMLFEIENESGVKISGEEICFHGLCSNCLK